MTQKELDKLSAPLRDRKATHLLLARTRNGIMLSSIATGDDIYEFLQVMVDTNPAVLDILEAVVESREKPKGKPAPKLLN